MTASVIEPWGRQCRLTVTLLLCIILGREWAWAQQSTDSYRGSVAGAPASPELRHLSIDEAIQMGLQYNLGLVLSNENARTAAGQRLQSLQALLPVVNASAKESVQQTNLQAEGLRLPGIPAVIGPYGYTDIRASAQSSLLNISSLRNYLAAKHSFAASNLSVQDARDLVVLTVGNAYLLCISDAARILSAQALVSSSKLSLDQANASHIAGTAPLLDVLRAQVDYQTEQQSLIVAQNQYEKDKIALARAIGLALDQKFDLSDQVPYAALDNLDANTAVQRALASRQDLKSLEEQVRSATQARSASTAERYPTVSASGDYGVIGPTLGHSHGTYDAVGVATVPVFDEAKLRGDARIAQSTLDQKQAQLSDLRGQISADVRDSILDIQAAAKEVEVSSSNSELAKEALREAQLRYVAGVSDNLAVSQAQSSAAQADQQYIASLYQHNVAKLSLARAMGIARTNYKDYLGGK
jgi:outer membrane protein TolC